ncbi:MAG: S-layer family protein [Thioploca sp.]|nr:S-layer family protein [Thioploca sp.]
MEAGTVLTASVGSSGDGGKIKITAQQVTLTTGGMVSVNTFGTGHAGKLTLNATDKLLVAENSWVNALVYSGANGGDIQIDAKQVVLETGGIISASTLGQGQGGNLNLTVADTLLITGKGNDDRSSAIWALVGSRATGDGGEVQIKAKQITVESGGQIAVNTFGAGNASKLTLIATDKLLITGKNGDNNSSIMAGVGSDATGAGSEVQIEAKQITVESGGRISADTFGVGNASKLTLSAADKLLIIGNNSLVSARSGGAGNGGDIQIEAKQITVESGGEISASTLGAGNAGKLTLTTTDKLLISSGVISAESMATGAGGEIQIEAKQVTLEARGQILTNAYEEGHAGKITLVAADELLITENSFIGASTVSGSKGNGGEIQVEAKQVILETGSQILVGTHGEGYAGKLTLSVADKLLITGDSWVETSTFGASGAGGDLQIKAKQVMLEAGGKISVGTFGTGHAGKLTLIATDKLLITGKESFVIAGVGPDASGAGGDVQIEAKQVTLEAGGTISVGTGGEKPAGKLTLIATDKLLITTGGWVTATVGPGASGVGGDVQIDAKQVTLEAGGEISVGTQGKGHAGKLTLIATDKLLISGDSFIEAGVQSGATGAGGDVQIKAKQVTLEAGGKIAVDTFGEGHAGNTLIATDKLLVTGKGSDGTTPSLIGASVQPDATGDGGNIKVEAKQVILAAGGTIFASTFGPGQGGNLNLTTDTLLITQGGAIGAGSSDNGGTAGEIIIKANGNIQLQNQNSRISAATDGAAGGNISITTTGLLQLTDQSRINTSVQANQGNGGNITLQPLFLILDDSKILAQAIEGHGGDINIKTNDIYVFPSSQFPQADNQDRLKQAINASSQLGVSGTITVNSPDINIGKNLVVFSTSITDASSKLKKCVATALSERSHFYIKRLPARRLVIDDLKASRLLFVSTTTPSAQTLNTPVDQSPPPVALLIGCHQEPNQESSTDAVPTQLF